MYIIQIAWLHCQPITHMYTAWCAGGSELLRMIVTGIGMYTYVYQEGPCKHCTLHSLQVTPPILKETDHCQTQASSTREEEIAVVWSTTNSVWMASHQWSMVH